MPSKYEYMDRIVLFLSCSFIYLAFHNIILSVLPLLAAISISCFLILFNKNVLSRMVLYVIYLLLSIYFLDMVYFIPLIMYDLMNEQQKLLLVLPLIPVSQFVLSYGFIESLLIIIVFIIAIFIRFKSIDIVSYKSKYYRLMDDTKELTLQLSQTNKDLIEKQDNDIYIATLNERNRIAREIHDHVGHQLSSSILQLGAIMAISKEVSIKEPLITLRTTLNTGMDNIRQSVHDLYDTSIDLDSKLNKLIQSFTFCSIEYDNGLFTSPEQKQCYAILAIVKESFSNIIKHSDATKVSVFLKEHPSLYQIIIHDNGSVIDFNPDHGIGLKNMEQRIEHLNGHFQIRINNGFEIFISLPKEV